MYGSNIPTITAITVSSGSGSQTLALNGKSLMIGVVAPSSGATYDIEILDDDGFGIYAATDLTGNFSQVYTAMFHHSHTIHITNATDGAYKVKVWFE